MYENSTLPERLTLGEFGNDWSEIASKQCWQFSGNRSMTDEPLNTTMCLVEQTLNARPITPASDDPSHLEALTPNHFILGRANVCIPFISDAETYSNHRELIRLCQAHANMIWER